jgi:nicotinamidase-related amidase
MSQTASTPFVLPKDAILLCIDVQKGFDTCPGRNNPQLEANIKSLFAAWRASGRKVWHTKHTSDNPTSPLRPNQPGHGFKEEAKPLPDEPVIEKFVNSAFIGTDLQDLLEAEYCESLVLCGLQTNYCVSTTARMAGNLGFDTYVIGDACATFDQKLLSGDVVKAQMVHDLNLADLHGEFATVINTKDVLAALQVAAKAT